MAWSNMLKMMDIFEKYVHGFYSINKKIDFDIYKYKILVNLYSNLQNFDHL